ncbi:metacaspase-2-like isoform X2 [Pararge aegeria]|uniref:metacaspase-2-like isoform X2 n=1 Tax=Pararge aegeria TaxID=116150 RepID=UPI0019D299F9|nr:metacaspase-2-like isoform X2 [Pararge aegeria]
MYSQIALLFCLLQSVFAYTLVQLKNGTEVTQVKELKNNTLEKISAEIKLQDPSLREIIFVVDRYLDKHDDEKNSIKKKPQKLPIPLDESVRPFTNGHGYQFAHWELVDEHQKAREGYSSEDKSTTGSDGGQGDYGDDTDNYDETARDGADKHDGNDTVQLNDRVRQKRHINYQNVPETPTQRIDHQAMPDYMNRMFTNRPTFENLKKTHGPILRDEHGNVYFENMSTVSGGSHLGSIPRAYGINLNNDQGYSWNHINNMQNEPIYNQPYNQAVQQRPFESHTVNNNPYRQIKPLNTPEAEIRNDKDISTSEINKVLGKNKLNQVSNYELPHRVPKKNFTQIIDRETEINNSEVNSNVRNKEDMIKTVNQISQRIGGIKNKIKDRFAINKNSSLALPEEKKNLTFGTSLISDKGETLSDIADPQVHINEVTPPNSNNITLCNDKLEAHNNTDENNATDAKIIETNYVYTERSANSSLNNVIINIDKVINTEMEILEEKTVVPNTELQNNQEPVSNLTVLESTPEEPEPRTIAIINAKKYKTNDEKDKELIKPLTIESFNENPGAEIEEETEDIMLTTEANNKTEEKCHKEKCKTTYNDNIDPVNLNFDELFNTDKFWDWLSKWTTSYMEILNENIQVLVKDEVAKQLEDVQLKTEIERDSFIQN